MKAAVLHAPQQPMTLEDVVLEKPKRREVLILSDVFGATPSNVAQRLANGVDVDWLDLSWGERTTGAVGRVRRSRTLTRPSTRSGTR